MPTPQRKQELEIEQVLTEACKKAGIKNMICIFEFERVGTIPATGIMLHGQNGKPPKELFELFSQIEQLIQERFKQAYN